MNQKANYYQNKMNSNKKIFNLTNLIKDVSFISIYCIMTEYLEHMIKMILFLQFNRQFIILCLNRKINRQILQSIIIDTQEKRFELDNNPIKFIYFKAFINSKFPLLKSLTSNINIVDPKNKLNCTQNLKLIKKVEEIHKFKIQKKTFNKISVLLNKMNL
ncbi:unnamed protein product [Paramecium sonneborni]|uniref:Uncharacterized protein n=1 Tax=Paramecium sonneborni TaxID=65129 RepID=A0A8S1RGY5_9CILI|nr:unnamed protein product [Paramecium sonneborni]